MEVLRINGIEKQFPDGIPKTLIELLKQLDINHATVVAEINGKIIEKQKFDIEVIIKASFTPMCRWNIEVGYQAVEMYAKGFLQQHIDSTNPPDNHKSLLDKIQKKMLKDLEHQIDRQGYYNPWGTMQLFLIQNLE